MALCMNGGMEGVLNANGGTLILRKHEDHEIIRSTMTYIIMTKRKKIKGACDTCTRIFLKKASNTIYE